MVAHDPADYLLADDIIQSDDEEVIALAQDLRQCRAGDVEYARAAYEWVRDRVAHSWDERDRRVTITATEVLRERVGLCFAKSHLYAALLRAEGIPAGLCYQRLCEADGHVLHGLVGVYLEDSWHRQDVRGNTASVDAQFSLGQERLAWPVDPGLGERDYPTVFAATAPTVRASLESAADALVLSAGGLPDRLGFADGRIGGVELHGQLVCSGPEQVDIVTRHLPRHLELTLAEPGCLAFEVSPTGRRFVWDVDEAFTDAAAFNAHQRLAAESDWGRATAGIERQYTITGLD